MKNAWFLLSLLALCVRTDAQSPGFFGGLNLGIQNSWIFNKNDFDEGGQLDFEATFKPAIGINLGYGFNSSSSIVSGLIYSQQGQKYITANLDNADYHTDLSYLKIPLLYQLNAGGQRRVNFLLQTGFQASVLMSARSSRNQVFGFYSPDEQDVKDNYAPFVVEFVLGLGLQVNFDKWAIQALIRPDYSLTDIEKTGEKSSSRDLSQNLTVGIPQIGVNYYLSR